MQMKREERGFDDYETAIPLTEFFKTRFGEGSICKEFDLLYSFTNLEPHVKAKEKSSDYDSLNRYTDILTYKDTRVVLKSRHNDYINACFVDGPMRANQIIAA